LSLISRLTFFVRVMMDVSITKLIRKTYTRSIEVILMALSPKFEFAMLGVFE